MEMNGGQALIKALELEGVEVVFGLPGGCILPVYDPLLDSPLRHILVRHEQGAGHMAEGYAHVTGRPGVAMVTSGPGATNIVTPLCDAFMDSIPMVAITGQVSTAAIGSDAFHLEALDQGLCSGELHGSPWCCGCGEGWGRAFAGNKKPPRLGRFERASGARQGA